MIISDALTKCVPWITTDQLCSAVNNVGTTYAADCVEAASDYLWRRTGCQYNGVCDTTLRPTVCGCGSAWGFCGCWKMELKAPGDLPILSIEEVRVGTTVIDPSEYTLLGEKYFVPRGISILYYPYQDMNVSPGEQGSWEIDITYGVEPPSLGKLAAIDLAKELLKACNGDDDCVLPHGVTSVTRDGVTYSFESISTGYTNIQTVDFFLSEHGGYTLGAWSGFGNPDSPNMVVETS